MPYFGHTSLQRLATVDERLQILANVVVKHWDCKIICGHRAAKEQNAAYNAGKTQLRWPFSKHNKKPSKAIDIAPWESRPPHIDWNDIETFKRFGSFVEGVAAALNIPIRWGGDWDGDRAINDQEFNDYVHFELDE